MTYIAGAIASAVEVRNEAEPAPQGEMMGGPMSSRLYKADPVHRDFEVLSSISWLQRYAKRPSRRWECWHGLGWWHRRTGL